MPYDRVALSRCVALRYGAGTTWVERAGVTVRHSLACSGVTTCLFYGAVIDASLRRREPASAEGIHRVVPCPFHRFSMTQSSPTRERESERYR